MLFLSPKQKGMISPNISLGTIEKTAPGHQATLLCYTQSRRPSLLRLRKTTSLPATSPYSQIDSDTVASVMAWAFYFLSKDAVLRNKLREELEPIMKGANGVEPRYAELAHASLLNSIINETMRLRTSVPLGGSRITPPEGLHVGDTWIPGGVTIFTPHHVIHHRKTYRSFIISGYKFRNITNTILCKQRRDIFKKQVNSSPNDGQPVQR